MPDTTAISATDMPAFAISVRQPWAWAIIHGGKDVENRVKRAITLGGMDRHKRIAIHASSGMTRDEYEEAREFMEDECGVSCPHPSKLVRGGIIGAVSIVGIVKESRSPWFFGPWALQLDDVEECDPIPCAGQLGAFRWTRGEGLREPLPWMLSWPERTIRARPVDTPSELPSFFDVEDEADFSEVGE